MQNPALFNEGSIKSFEEELFLMHDPDTTDVERIQCIIDVKYNEADLDAVVKDINTINKQQTQQVSVLLSKYKELFDGGLGSWKADPIKVELKDPNCKPYHAKPYPVPFSQEKKLKAEVKCLVDWGILKR